MRRIAALLFAIAALSAIQIDLFAQGRLWGVTPFGGPSGAGVIFKINSDGTGYSLQKDFSIENSGANPFYTQLAEGPNGKLYGLTGNGGANNAGVLFEFDPSSGNYTSKWDFDGPSSGANPSGSLLTALNGKLYGMTLSGGDCNYGVLFEYDPSNGNYTKKQDFCYTQGAGPFGSLVQALNGKLYGMTSGGGVYQYGVLFEFDPSTGDFVKKLDFESGTMGAYPYGSLMKASNGKLFGMTGSGGVYGAGVLFEFDPSNGNYNKKLDFESTTKGSAPYGSLTQADNGKLYGMTFRGGANNSGVLFEYDPSNGNYATKREFGFAGDGTLPYGSLTKAANGNLYAMTTYGGAHGSGTLFEYNPTTDHYAKKLDFESAATGSIPYGTLLQVSNGKFYGMTSAGGSDGLGLLFEYDPSLGEFVKKVNFGSSVNGAAPLDGLVEGGNGRMYGMTSHGGLNGKGVLFEYDRIQGTYAKKFDFSPMTGSYPLGKLTKASNGNLYGMTSEGGANGFGVLFEYDPSNGNYIKKIDFDNATNGAYPRGNGLAEVAGKLYGAIEGGANGAGVLFEFEPVHGNFSVKILFQSVDNGEKPTGTLVKGPNGKLYGMTHNGGANNLGVLYEFDPSVGNYLKLMDFDFTVGAFPLGSLVLAANGKLYGATSYRGANNTGTLFEFDSSNGSFSKKLDFPSSLSIRGDWPLRGLTLSPNGKIYGTTTYGGDNDQGALFEFDPSNSNFVKKHDFIGATGSNPYYSSLVVVDAGQTISFNSLPAKIYGDSPFSLTATVSSGLPITYVSSDPLIAAISGNIVTILKTGAATITASQAGNDNYFPAPAVQQTLTINKGTPVVTWTNPSDIDFGIALEATQLNAIANVPGMLTYTPAAGTVLSVGANQILSVNFAPTDAINYDPVDNVQVQINVIRAGQVITFASLPTKTLGDADFTLSATASSGLPVAFGSSSDKVTLSGSQATIDKAGRVTITANQIGNDSYRAAAPMDQSFCINPPKPTISKSNAGTGTPTLTSSASNGNQWYVNGTAITGATNGELIAAFSGTYKVQVKADDCTSEFSEEMPLVITGDLSDPSRAVEVYPNPVESYFEIRGLSGEVTDSQLFDMMGRSNSLPLERKDEGYRAPVQQLSQGIYLLRVQTSTSVQQIKFVKK